MFSEIRTNLKMKRNLKSKNFNHYRALEGSKARLCNFFKNLLIKLIRKLN